MTQQGAAQSAPNLWVDGIRRSARGGGEVGAVAKKLNVDV
jgi:hypothetical protein